MVDRDYVRAEAEFQRAIQIRPNYTEAHYVYGVFLGVMLHPDESIASIQRALALDPLSDFFSAALGVSLRFNRRYDESLSS